MEYSPLSSCASEFWINRSIDGFFSPSGNLRWKRGQTVPIKVALGDVNGVRIPDAEAQALLSPTCRVLFVAVGNTAWQLANRDQRIVVDKPLPQENGR